MIASPLAMPSSANTPNSWSLLLSNLSFLNALNSIPVSHSSFFLGSRAVVKQYLGFFGHFLGRPRRVEHDFHYGVFHALHCEQARRDLHLDLVSHWAANGSESHCDLHVGVGLARQLHVVNKAQVHYVDDGNLGVVAFLERCEDRFPCRLSIPAFLHGHAKPP